jgi:hypothetical protein
VTKEQAAARAKLLRACVRAQPSDRLIRAIIYAEPGRKHVRSIIGGIRKLRGRVNELQRAAKAWSALLRTRGEGEGRGMTEKGARPAMLGLQGWEGLTWQPVEVIGETPKRYRIRAITDTRLAGRYRMLFRGETALVPRSAVRFAEERG